MEAADLLRDSLFRWLENWKECEENLLKLAQKLEKVHQGINIAQGIGAAATALLITGAVAAGFLTGGLALPLLAVAATVGTAGVAVRVTSPLVETGISRKTIKKVNKLIEEDEKVGTRIQKQLRDLKDRCGGAKLGDHAEELECEVVTQLMWTLARRNNTHISLDFLRAFNRATVFRHLTSGGLDPAEAESFICRALGLDPVPVIKSSLKVLDAIGSDRSLNNSIVTCEEIVERKGVTVASKFLRDSAREILEGRQELKKQLDAMHEINQKLFQMKNLITDLGGYSLRIKQDRQNITDYSNGISGENTVDPQTEEEAQWNEFIDLLQFYLERLRRILPDLSEPDGRHIDIVIVAHGSIVDQFMPASIQVLARNITDTILYSPWNCSIDSRAAFGIAQGNIQVTDREFQNMANCEPDPLPDHWNSMQGSDHNIPGILLSPINLEEEAWTNFDRLRGNTGIEIEDRVIIPYLDPQDQVNAIGDIPLHMFILVISVILADHDKTATVHLAANLTRRAGSPLMPEEWRTQYAYTSDGTVMTVNMEDVHMQSLLFRALRSLFDLNHD